MATSFSKFGLPSTLRTIHPFKVDIIKAGREDNRVKYKLSVNYHSRLFTGMTLNENFLSYKKTSIKGLDFIKEVPQTFPGKNFYCVLKIKVKNLTVEDKDGAEITWVEDDKSVEPLNPVLFESGSNLKQKEARIIIATLVNDAEEVSATTDGKDEAKTDYIIQNVNTNLMMCNMVFNGVPIIYPVPFAGGRLNF